MESGAPLVKRSGRETNTGLPCFGGRGATRSLRAALEDRSEAPVRGDELRDPGRKPHRDQGHHHQRFEPERYVQDSSTDHEHHDEGDDADDAGCVAIRTGSG